MLDRGPNRRVRNLLWWGNSNSLRHTGQCVRFGYGTVGNSENVMALVISYFTNFSPMGVKNKRLKLKWSRLVLIWT